MPEESLKRLREAMVKVRKDLHPSLIDTYELADVFFISHQHFLKWVRDGVFPVQPIDLDAKQAVWRRSNLAKYFGLPAFGRGCLVLEGQIADMLGYSHDGFHRLVRQGRFSLKPVSLAGARTCSRYYRRVDVDELLS